MKLSVITINLNNAPGLQKTIDSVMQQSFTNFEYIIIDGGSKDGSTEILKKTEKLEEAAKGPASFKYISELDTGIYNAMNKGIKMAKGDYCYFLNSGDYLLSPEVFSLIFKEEYQEEILFGNLLVGSKGFVHEKAIGKKELTFIDIYRSSLKHQASFIKRTLFDTYGLYNENLKIVADWEFFLKTVGLKNVTYRYVNVDVAFFDNEGLSFNSGDRTVKEREQVLQENIPSMMLSDYRRFDSLVFLEPAMKNAISRFGLRVIAKLSKIIKRK